MNQQTGKCEATEKEQCCGELEEGEVSACGG